MFHIESSQYIFDKMYLKENIINFYFSVIFYFSAASDDCYNGEVREI